MLKSRLWILIAVAIVSALAGLWMAASLRAPDAPALQTGTLLEPARSLPEFSLLSGAGQPFTKAQLQGRWSLLFFGFTNCPDVCPTTLASLAQVHAALADLTPGLRPQVVFVSVDPKRDSPEQVARYTGFFNPQFIGVTGEQDQVDALTRALGIPVIIHPLENGAYTVDHSSAVLLIDPSARLRALFSAPHTQSALAADIRRIVSQS